MYIIISASPNTDGLTAACAQAALDGFRAAGAEALHLRLCDMKLERCRQCGNGWGSCRTEHACVIDDDLRGLQEALAAAEGLVIVTPVYYGEPSESAKCALDRLRRCEATRGDAGALTGKPVLSVAAAGGSGGGVTSCLTTLERWTHHLRGQVVDVIGITRRSRSYQLAAITAAAAGMATPPA